MAHKVCVVGSGNWGCAIARMIGQNILANKNTPAVFSREVIMWVFEEVMPASMGPKFAGRKLTDIINKDHENPKYLAGFELPPNVIAEPDLVRAVDGASLLIFVVPHQFLPRTLNTLKGKISPKARAITLIKGISFDSKGVVLLSSEIEKSLGISCCALMGANVASQVANDEPAEATVGFKNADDGILWRELFNRDSFRVNIIKDVPGVELCGALKNIVAVGAGISDGLGFKDNTKAALVRIGLLEMKRFSAYFFPPAVDQTYLESCGVADLITTCYAGRNRKVAEAFVRANGSKTFEQLEEEMLNGQKLQGTLTASEVHEVLQRHNMCHQFPLFTAVYEICFENRKPSTIVYAMAPVSDPHDIRSRL